MNLGHSLMVCALAIAGLTVGCGDKCKSECDHLKNCPQGSQLPSALSCDKYCNDTNKVVDAAKCDSQLNDLWDCEDKKQDKCDTTDQSCDGKSSTVGTCIASYCQAHATASECTTYYADFSTSAN
ncbi:MAG TPA: hypothetical protein VMI54_00520 [Polyangiaceae bacterium]|nr:hypothetical protein [Polyangiaceae bacterium]